MGRAPTTTDLPTPERVLTIGAHPDDAEFQCGATLAKWSAAGAEVSMVICTDGSKGTWDPDAELTDLVAARQREQHAAAEALGVRGEVVFLGWTDGEVQPTTAAQAEVALAIRRLRPDVVLTHDPWKRYRLHPDHRNVGWLALDAIVAARDPHFFSEQRIAHHRPGVALLFEADEPDHAEDASGWADAKIDALERHESQFESTMGIPVDDAGAARSAFRARIHERLSEVGQRYGLDAAEEFKVLRDL